MRVGYVKGHIRVESLGIGLLMSGAGARLVAAFRGGGIAWGGAVTGAETCGEGISHLE